MSARERTNASSRAGQGEDGRAGRPRLEVARGGVTAPDGLVLVDKPAGFTSHDVVGAVRRMAATRKVGHAGTLDPMATGLLLIGIGRATRFLTYLVGEDKTYEATIRLGQTTGTEDAEGEVTGAVGCLLPGQHRGDDAAARPGQDAAAAGGPVVLAPGALGGAMAGLTGQIMQVPSAVSAIKVDGVRSYDRVRAGETVELEARPVTVSSFTAQGEPRAEAAADGTPVVDVDVTVRCSSGTYVRALARDLGQALGCGAHLTALRRTEVGPFSVREAARVELLSALVQADAARKDSQGMPTLPLEVVARRRFASVELTAAQVQAVSFGQMLPISLLDVAVLPAGRPGQEDAPALKGAGGGSAGEPETPVAAFAPDGRLVALLVADKGRLRPSLVLAPAH